MAQTVTVPISVDDSTKLQKLINSTGNTPVKYEFSPDHEIEIDSLLRVYNFTEWDGQGCKFSLMENAPLSPFASGIPLIAPRYPTSAEGLIFHDIVFDGCRDSQARVEAKHPKPWGKGFHNTFMLGSLNNVNYSNSLNCEFYNLRFYNSLGDGIRVEGGTDIRVHDILGKMGGHDIVCLAGTNGGDVYNVNAKLAVNAGVRTRSSKNIKIHDCTLDGATGIAYSPGIQIQSTASNWITDNIEIYNNYISGTYGPGIQIAGSVPDSGLVSVHNNLIVGCGAMPAASKLSGVGGIAFDGIPVDIRNNTIDSCYGYGILAGKYTLASTYAATALIRKNIITNTKKALYPGTGSGSGIADLTGGRYTITAEDNCVWNSALSNHYKVSFTDYIRADPLYAGEGDYHLQSRGGHYAQDSFIVDHVSSPVLYQDYELGCYNDTNQASIYLPPAPPSVVIPRKNEDDLRAFVLALKEAGYLEEGDEVTFQNVSEGFKI